MRRPCPTTRCRRSARTSRSWRTSGLVYLDSGATSQKPIAVLDAERAYLVRGTPPCTAAPTRLAAEATELFEDARATVAGFIGADEDEVAWTGNATGALNTVAYAIGNASAGRGGAEADRFRLRAGDEIVVTELEHHANLIPWQELAARTGATLRFIPVDDEGALRMDEAARVIGPATRIVAFSHVSNVLGGVNPVDELVALAAVGRRAHGAGRMPVRAEPARRRAGARRRLRRVLRAQDAGADRASARSTGGGSCWTRCRRSSPAGR